MRFGRRWPWCVTKCYPPSAVVRGLAVAVAVVVLNMGMMCSARAQGWVDPADQNSGVVQGVSYWEWTAGDPDGHAERAEHEGHAEHAEHEGHAEHAEHDGHAEQEAGHGDNIRLVGISLDGLFAAGASTVRDPSLQELEGGGHDPRKRGFTVRNVEFSMQGAIDPYLDGEMYLVSVIDPIEGETVVELEEAFMTTQSLPRGLQLKAGHFFTEFGRINPTHPHAWAWLDQPIINTRVFGPDGMRAPGARLSWQLPTEHLSRLYASVQNANGETMASFLANNEFFEERPIGGRPFVYRDVRSLGDLVCMLRWENSWTSGCKELTWTLGQSAAFGPNCTGRNGNTQIYGLDLSRRWAPTQDEHGWPFSLWTSEVIVRRYRADSYVGPDPANPAADLDLLAATLFDGGLYTQYLYGFAPKWAAGLRYEYVWGSGDSLNSDFAAVSHNEDPFRDNRHRLSPLLAWYPTEYCRFNLQYNYDNARHLPSKDAHSFWVGAEFMLGAHPAHKH